MRPQEILNALFWLAILGMAVIAGAAVMERVQGSVRKAL